MKDLPLQVRSVAEYAYCPRLFYFIQVEGIFVPSSDTEKGVAAHSRVDKPSRAVGEEEDSANPELPKVYRSLALTSDSLGISATLDLAEISGKEAVPIEYRKGRPNRRKESAGKPSCPREKMAEEMSPEPWPADLIQVGLQALLLEEQGYIVREAVIYYAEEKARLRVVVDADLKNRSLDVLEEAKRCAEGLRPLPLLNDPKCIRCSLQPICLPDEINLQRSQEEGDSLKPRKIWPPRDDGVHFVIQRPGTKVGVRGREIRVTGDDGSIISTMPMAGVESLSLIGSVQLTTQALTTLCEKGITIAFLSSAGRPIALIDPLDSVSAEVRKAQVHVLDNHKRQMELARALVTSKILNQRTILLRNHKNLPKNVPPALAEAARLASRAENMGELRGYEGQAASIYFKNFGGMFKTDIGKEFEKHGRKRRPSPDPINACLSMGYSMLTHECVAALRLARLEPSIGVFHSSRPGRPALALDLMEPFRPLISDSVAITCFNRGELSQGHFLKTAAGCILTEAGRRSFFNAYNRRMSTEITHQVFKYRLSYRRMIVLHARMIAAWMMDEVPNLSFLVTR